VPEVNQVDANVLQRSRTEQLTTFAIFIIVTARILPIGGNDALPEIQRVT